MKHPYSGVMVKWLNGWMVEWLNGCGLVRDGVSPPLRRYRQNRDRAKLDSGFGGIEA